ncbi:18313_t:CDS:2 [Funneliformis geosporum]|nr:18313_t:CDS:2 [Funneliformis geosporum]
MSLRFWWIKNEIELACQLLLPQQLNNRHLVYNKLSFSKLQELYKAQRAYASWILDKTIPIGSLQDQ